MAEVQEWLDRPKPREPLYIIIFKSRQIGLSWLLAAIATYLCTFFESSKVLELSKKEKDAGELLEKSKFITRRHPDWLRLKLEPDQQSELGFPATHGKIQALPSTKDAGRSSDATMVICDEWEYHPYAADNFGSVKPTIAKGGLFVACSTVDKTNFETFAKVIYNDTEKSGFISHFFDYFVVPGRTEETRERDAAGLPEWLKESEYPRNEREALSVPQSTCYFDRQSIIDLWEDVEHIKPIEERYGGKIRIYKRPVSDRKYILAGDSSEGQYDPAAFIIQDWATEEDVVAVHGKMSMDEQAKLIFELYAEYNNPFVGIERNAGGVGLIEKLVNMGITNWYNYRKETPGWWTQTSNRPVMLLELAEGINLRLVRIPMIDALSEFLNFQWIDGKPQAVRGTHDDWVMAHAIARQIRKEIKAKRPVRVSSFKYKQEF